MKVHIVSSIPFFPITLGRQIITQSWKEDLAFRKESVFVIQNSYQENYCVKLCMAWATIQQRVNQHQPVTSNTVPYWCQTQLWHHLLFTFTFSFRNYFSANIMTSHVHITISLITSTSKTCNKQPIKSYKISAVWILCSIYTTYQGSEKLDKHTLWDTV